MSTKLVPIMLTISTGIIVTRVFDGSLDTVTEGIFKELLAHEVVVYALGDAVYRNGHVLYTAATISTIRTRWWNSYLL
ncbi:hypothetical protein ACT7DA_18435 [Bacillus pacificus]